MNILKIIIRVSKNVFFLYKFYTNYKLQNNVDSNFLKFQIKFIFIFFDRI